MYLIGTAISVAWATGYVSLPIALVIALIVPLLTD